MIRKAKVEDAPAIRRIISEYSGNLLPRSEQEVLDMINCFWVAEHEAEIVGCCCLEVYSPKIAELRSLAVVPGQTGNGYGRRLVEAAVAEGRRLHIPEILVVTENREFFERMGFGQCLRERFALFWNGRDS